jgi:hypothetical protein
MSVASEFMNTLLAGQQFQRGQQQMQVQNLNMQTFMQEEPARLQSLQADAQLKALQVKTAQQQEAASAEFAKLISSQQQHSTAAGSSVVTGSAPPSVSDLLQERAQVLFEHGLGTEGVATLKDAAELEAKQATTAKTQADTHGAFLGSVAQWIDTPGMSKQDIVGQISMYFPQFLQDKQVQQILKTAPDDPTPQQREMISNALRTQKDRLEQQYRQAQIKHEAASTAAENARAQLERINAGLDDNTDRMRAKAGDPPAEGPTNAQIRAAILVTPGAVLPSGGIAAQNVAFRDLKEANPGKSAKEIAQMLVGAGGKSAGGMFGGSYAARFPQRVIAASTEGLAQLETISKIGASTGIPTQGVFKGNAVGSGKTGSVAQLLTTPQQKMYNATLAGLAPELASAQNQGLSPTEAQINNTIQNLSIYPTDDAQTAQFKVALLARDFRKALEGGIENMQPKQQTRAKELISELQRFPDPDVIANAKPGDNMFPPGAFGAVGVHPTIGGEGGIRAAPPTSGWGKAQVVQ